MLTVKESMVTYELEADAAAKVAHARRRYGDDYADELEATYRSEIDNLMNAFWYVPDGYSWTHLRFSENGTEFEDFGITQEFNLIADKYFSSSPLRSKSLDWFFVDVLIISAYVKLFYEYQRDLFPKNFKLKTIRRSLMYWLAVWYSITWLFKWLFIIGLVGLFAVIGLEHPAALVVSAGIVGLVIYYKERKRRLMKPVVMHYCSNMLLVQRVYELTSTPNINWDVLESELEDTRKKGIGWHSALYSAIKSRRADPMAIQPLTLQKLV